MLTRSSLASGAGTLSALFALVCTGCDMPQDGSADEGYSDSSSDAGVSDDKALAAGCDDTLAINEYLTSPNGAYRLYLQSDGNLVLRNTSTMKALWASGTNGKGGVKLILQGDGNLVLSTSSGAGVWTSGTAGKNSDSLRVNDNGSLVLYAGSTAVWSKNGTASLSGSGTATSQLCTSGGGVVDECPNDPKKTSPGQCGCGVAEGTCSGNGSGAITQVGTTVVYDPNGQGLTIARPGGSRAGDLMVLFLHRTDDYLPHSVSGWTHAAECYKAGNGSQCASTGQDLAQGVFYRTVGTNEAGSYTFNLNQDNSGHPGWAVLTALRGAATTDPVRDSAGVGCDNDKQGVFPSVYGKEGDILLLSQSFDDPVGKGVFQAPNGTQLFGYVDGERQYVSQADQKTTLVNDETGFLFGGILKATGETGKRPTTGPGVSNQGQYCKDALISLTIKPR